MEIKQIESMIDDAWYETTLRWQDEKANQFHKAVVVQAKECLAGMMCLSSQLDQLIEATLSDIDKVEMNA